MSTPITKYQKQIPNTKYRKTNTKKYSPKKSAIFMLKSMTAYGRAFHSSPIAHFVAEIQSLNRKHLEVLVFLPPELSYFEADVRKIIEKVIFRGKITLKVSATFEGSSPISVKPNIPFAKQIKEAWTAIGKELNITQPLTFEMLSGVEGVLSYQNTMEDEGAYKIPLEKAVLGALKELTSMKLIEGKAISADFISRIVNLENAINCIEPLVAGQVDQRKAKLKLMIENELPEIAEHEDRILREICLYADRVDVSEEVTRFRSHLSQFKQVIDSDIEAKGKTLEFILQELGREINTIGSKSSDVEISQHVIGVKTELERIREQVQNIE